MCFREGLGAASYCVNFGRRRLVIGAREAYSRHSARVQVSPTLRELNSLLAPRMRAVGRISRDYILHRPACGFSRAMASNRAYTSAGAIWVRQV